MVLKFCRTLIGINRHHPVLNASLALLALTSKDIRIQRFSVGSIWNWNSFLRIQSFDIPIVLTMICLIGKTPNQGHPVILEIMVKTFRRGQVFRYERA